MGGMKFDIIVGNPPYDRNLHLKIINTVIKFLEPDGTGCFIHPARWIIDPLSKWKKNSDYNKFKDIVGRIVKTFVVCSKDSYRIFGISTANELCITCVNGTTVNKFVGFYNNIAREAVDCVYSYCMVHNLKKVIEFDSFEGWRVSVPKGVLTGSGDRQLNDNDKNRKRWCDLFFLIKDNVYFDGKLNGVQYSATRSKNQFSKDVSIIPCSIRFGTKEEAYNFVTSCRTNFYSNYLYLVKFSFATPFAYLPFMEDYSHPWTDEDYCKFFGELGMSEECQKWMCRDVYDYRVKDFIKYVNFD